MKAMVVLVLLCGCASTTPPQRLMSVTEWNETRRVEYMTLELREVWSGIACPTCGSGFIDAEPGIVYDSYTPMKSIRCPKCGYFGYVLL